MKWNKKNLEYYKEKESEEFNKQFQELKIESNFDKQLQESEEELTPFLYNPPSKTPTHCKTNRLMLYIGFS